MSYMADNILIGYFKTANLNNVQVIGGSPWYDHCVYTHAFKLYSVAYKER